MIDICQWRSSIGSWYYHQISYHAHCTKKSPTSDVTTDNSRINGVTRIRWIRGLTFSLVCGLLLLLILSGDIELNPGPITELTSSNALRLLVKSGFIVKEKWTQLISLLGVSLDERRRLKTMANTDHDYHFALEEGLQWWINNCSSTVSWEELISAVEKCEDCSNIANIMRKEIGIVNQKPDIELSPGPITDCFQVSDDEVRKAKEKIRSKCQYNPVAQGIIFVVDMLFVDKSGNRSGTDVDADNIYKTFRDYLNFATIFSEDLTCTELACLVKAAAEFDRYPLNYDFVAFYYAGHGGIDSSGREFVLPLQLTSGDTKHVLYIKDNIICPFTCESAVLIRDRYFLQSYNKNRKCLFFFDCCLIFQPDLAVHGTEKVFNLKCPQDCLVAYATSINFMSGGSKTYGGLWTRHLCQRLKNVEPLSTILDRTIDDVKDAQATSTEKNKVTYQLPHYETNAGLIYLKGHSISDEDTSISTLDPDVQQYCDIMRDKYKRQPIVPTDWPPRVGQDFFGRLALLESQDRQADPGTIQQTAWCVLRGNIDEIPHFTNNKSILIDIEDVFKPNESGQSLTIVIDGPPGIGKTTLCRKLLNMWANGQIKHQQYDLVIYCPLRNIKIAQASTLRNLFVYECHEVDMVTEWFERRHGEGLLIIFDGWDELGVELRQSSLTTRIICKELLEKCSVIVTSRSYASSSLLDIDSINRHVEVMGFTVKEIKNVVRGTLEKEPLLAESLIQDLKVRGDVRSLCYIPLVCSIVILVYRKEKGHLPTTLTQLYENFILQTIRRYVKKTQFTEPDQINSLHHLPSPVIATPFQEMCKFAYLSLKESNPRMTFSLFQVQQSLNESVVKADYLGLITTFTVCGEKSYQFLHLSIQEFLAAWWITMYEKTEKVFNDHFNDDHFRMCLRFVSGLTNLEHEDYKQYFNKEIDLQCKRIPQFGFEACYHSRFQQHPEIQLQSSVDSNHYSSEYFDKLDILLLHLLYESQNTTLCQVLAQSMKNHSLCLHRVRLSSLFDILCLSYFLNNSNTSWNHLDLSVLNHQQVQILTNTLTNNSEQNQCKILEVLLFQTTGDSVYKLLKPSFLHNIQEFYCTLCHMQVDLCLVIIELLNLPLIKVLHLLTDFTQLHTSTNSIFHTEKYSKLEKCMAMNSTLLEMKLQCKSDYMFVTLFKPIASLINGVTRNNIITSVSFEANNAKLIDRTIEHLLKDNQSLQTLKLNIPDLVLLSPLNIVEVNTTLSTLEIGPLVSRKMLTSLLDHIKGLHCIKLYNPYQPHHLFHSHPSLQQLDLPLDTSESVIELFTLLQSNTTLKSLRVEIRCSADITDSMCTSLQNMLIQNKTIEYLEIECGKYITSTYLSFLITGLSHNTSLQELSIFIPVSDTNNEQIRTFFNLISQKNHLTELKLHFKLGQAYIDDHMKRASLFYEQVLPLVTNMLELHTTIKLLQIRHFYFSVGSSPPINWMVPIQHFLQAIFLHPSLEYICIKKSKLSRDTYKAQEKSLIDLHKKHYPLKPLPIINFY